MSNGIDEELVYRGLLNPDEVNVLEVEALVDPVSVRTVIPATVAEKLGLDSTQQTINYADGSQEVIALSDSIIIEIQGRTTGGEAIVAGSEVIIGSIALETLDFVVDYENKRLIPNPKHPDYPIFRI
ncbi:MAG: clan AA aspartic protease [Calothrix sp. SM1_7_51]|nr:clan AA aspartic protease [Calothrix sp. SM1_7_51]